MCPIGVPLLVPWIRARAIPALIRLRMIDRSAAREPSLRNERVPIDPPSRRPVQPRPDPRHRLVLAHPEHSAPGAAAVARDRQMRQECSGRSRQCRDCHRHLRRSTVYWSPPSRGRSALPGRNTPVSVLYDRLRSKDCDPINPRILLLHCVHSSDKRRKVDQVLINLYFAPKVKNVDIG